MSDSEGSRRQILSSTSLLGGASIATLLLSVVRTKVFALLLGPAGVGLLGLLNNLLTSASLLAGMGLHTSGVRLVSEAAASGDERAIGRARKVLFFMSVILALAGGLLLWFFREAVATHLLGDPARAHMAGWIGVGVALTLLAASQLALLNGLRRIGDIARLQIGGALLATLAGIAAILQFGEQGLLLFVLAVPAAAFLIGSWFVHRLRIPPAAMRGGEMVREGVQLARLGATFMLAQLAISAGMLAIRTRIETELGLVPLGLFEAAWLVSSVYLGAVLTAMTTDYYPRLAALADQPEASAALINDQARIALWLCGPLCLALIALAPLAATLLFSSRFAEAAGLIRFLAVGDLLKLLAWPLGFLLLARGDGRRYLLLESSAILTFVGVTTIALPMIGLVAAALGYAVMYCLYLPLARRLVRRHLAFDWDSGVRRDALLLLGAALSSALLASLHAGAGALLGLLLALLFGWRSFRRLREVAGEGGWRALLRPAPAGPETRSS